MDADEIARKKQKLVEQMEKARLERGIERNPSEDHAVALRTLQNPLRRNVVKFTIYKCIKSVFVDEAFFINICCKFFFLLED